MTGPRTRRPRWLVGALLSVLVAGCSGDDGASSSISTIPTIKEDTEVSFDRTTPSAVEGFPVPAGAIEERAEGFADVSFSYLLPGASLSDVEAFVADYAGRPFNDWDFCDVRNISGVRFYTWTRNEVAGDAETLVVSVSDVEPPLTISYNRSDAPC